MSQCQYDKREMRIRMRRLKEEWMKRHMDKKGALMTDKHKIKMRILCKTLYKLILKPESIGDFLGNHKLPK